MKVDPFGFESYAITLAGADSNAAAGLMGLALAVAFGYGMNRPDTTAIPSPKGNLQGKALDALKNLRDSGARDVIEDSIKGALSALGAYVTSEFLKSLKYKSRLKNNDVYILIDKLTTYVVYVGITVDTTARLKAHKKDPRFSNMDLDMLVVKRDLTRTEARYYEQALINAYRNISNVFQNSINSIAPWRVGLGNDPYYEFLYWKGE